MKLFITLAFCAFFTVSTLAQNPYEQFGVKGKLLQTESEKSGEHLIILKNNDTTSLASIIIINVDSYTYEVYDSDHKLIRSGDFSRLVNKKWQSPDPLKSDFPSKSPYNFVSNDPINRIDPDGMADYYHTDGTYLGNDGSESDNVFAINGEVDFTDHTEGEFNLNEHPEVKSYSVVDLDITHKEFVDIYSTIYNEDSRSLDVAWAIYDVLENRVDRTMIRYGEEVSIWDIIENTAVYGKDDRKELFMNYDKGDYTIVPVANKERVKNSISGTIWGRIFDNGTVDKSKGALFWHGPDLYKKGSPAYNTFFSDGFLFTESSHNLFPNRLSSYSVKGKGVNNKKYSYHFQTTTAYSQTTFIVPTDSYLKSTCWDDEGWIPRNTEGIVGIKNAF